jgi:FKBP-type peptidyl-prolyl cis-trans isomerase 2
MVLPAQLHAFELCVSVVCGNVFAGAQVIKGFDTAVTGLAVGQTNKVRVTPEDAYGQVGMKTKRIG